LLESPIFGDIETVLRTASLAVLSGADGKTVSVYLKRAADAKATDSKLRKAEAKGTMPSLLAEPDAGLYVWMLATNATAQLATEAKILRQVATALNRRS
jgi:hypothetical protein